MRTIEIDLALHKQIETGRRRFDESESEILKRLINDATLPHRVRTPQAQDWRYVIDVLDQTVGSNGLNEAYLTALKHIGRKHPDALRQLSKINYPRGKILSRSRDDLFKTAPHLRRQFARPVGHGYVADANLNAQQVKSRLMKANRILAHRGGGFVMPRW